MDVPFLSLITERVVFFLKKIHKVSVWSVRVAAGARGSDTHTRCLLVLLTLTQAWSLAAATPYGSSDHTRRRHAVHGMTGRCEEDLHTRRRDCFLYWAGAGRLRSGDKNKNKNMHSTHMDHAEERLHSTVRSVVAGSRRPLMSHVMIVCVIPSVSAYRPKLATAS